MGSIAKAQPNIVLIVADDQGYHDLGAYGSEDVFTPHLDQLATEGVRLTNFYVTSSICTPSRSGLLTGRYPQRNGTFELFRNDMVDMGHQYTEQEYSISPERVLGTDLREVFLSELLQQAGYTNGIFGKWDFGQLKRYLPLQQGFNDFYGFVNTGIDYYTHERYGTPSMFLGNKPTTADSGTYSTYLFEREALA
ncbi:MAG: sulfatase-like hydrolase/transferase, partial [Tunicatimonas sp.]|uniref:sulfatase-like hydrolase/transferase n=1 Tax=Tunicatimonas sp. TaxID=1940096 RepID=UPI003C77ECC9